GSRACAFSPDGARLAMAVNEERMRSAVKVWTVATRQVTAEFSHEGGVDSLAFSPDGKKLLTFGQDHAVRICEFEKEQLELRIPGTPTPGWQRRVAVFSPDGMSIAIGDETGHIRL